MKVLLQAMLFYTMACAGMMFLPFSSRSSSTSFFGTSRMARIATIFKGVLPRILSVFRMFSTLSTAEKIYFKARSG